MSRDAARQGRVPHRVRHIVCPTGRADTEGRRYNAKLDWA